MAGFLYFVPSHTESVTEQQLVEAGLGYAIEGGFSQRGCKAGPDGSTGVIVGRPDDDDIGYYPDRQTWRQIPKSAAYCGCVTASPPGPDDLIRTRGLIGRNITLGDGHEWHVPLIRGLVEVGEQLRYV